MLRIIRDKHVQQQFTNSLTLKTVTTTKALGYALALVTLLGFPGCETQSGQPENGDPAQTDSARPDKPTLTPPPSVAAVIPRQRDTKDDPSADGWTTEVISQKAGASMTQIIEHAISGTTSQKALPIASAFQSTDLREEDLLVAANDGPVRVVSWKRPAETPVSDSSLLNVIVERIRKNGAKKIVKKLKITRVDESDGANPSTELRLELYGKSPQGTTQATCLMDCSWRIEAGNAAPLLTALDLKSLEEVSLQTEHETWFREVTPSVMQNAPSYKDQLLYDDDYWSQRVEQRLGSNFMGNHGITVGDVNGDLLDDLYVSQTGGIPNRLYLQQPDGTLREAENSGVDILDSTRAALIIDLDNDGDQDLVVASITGTLFYENNDNARFTFRHRERAAAFGYSIVAADYDLDGDLDIYACCYNARSDSEFPNPVPYHDARNGPPNVLIANDGDWKFHDATNESGLGVENDRWTYAASWHDVDSDGDPDLYVPNDFGRNWLFINENGKFTNRAAELGVEDIASGMSATWGDWNRDGRMDVYVSNMFSSAGNRVTYQRKFKSDSQTETKQSLQRLARGNSLFQAQSDGSFQDVTLSANVEMGRWAWSSNFADINNDGWQDLVVANGNYTGTDSGDL